VPSAAGGAALLVLLAALALLAACRAEAGDLQGQVDFPDADLEQGRAAFVEFGCVSCHTIPGVGRAGATVGPPLTDWSDRAYIAGRFPNTPENLLRWIMVPQEMDPGNVMPNMGVPDRAARDMAAYLYTLGEGRAFQDGP
jgi:cytochrome c2